MTNSDFYDANLLNTLSRPWREEPTVWLEWAFILKEGPVLVVSILGGPWAGRGGPFASVFGKSRDLIYEIFPPAR